MVTLGMKALLPVPSLKTVYGLTVTIPTLVKLAEQPRQLKQRELITQRMIKQ